MRYLPTRQIGRFPFPRLPSPTHKKAAPKHPPSQHLSAPTAQAGQPGMAAGGGRSGDVCRDSHRYSHGGQAGRLPPERVWAGKERDQHYRYAALAVLAVHDTR